MRTTLVGPLVLCLLAGPAAANVIGIGLDWRKNVFVQEYWKDGTAHYLIANRGKAPVTITVTEWKAQGAGPKLAGPWEVKAGAVLDVEAPKIKGEQFVLWQLADGTDLGLLGPPRAPAEKPGEKVATYDGLNGSGGRRFDVYCEQAKAGFPSDGTFEVKLVLSSAASARGVLTFRKKKSLDALPETVIVEAKSDTLPVQADDKEVRIDSNRPLKEAAVHHVTLRFRAPEVEAPALAAFNGSFMMATGGGFGLTRGVLVKPK